jgi:hypothetical protein
VIAGIPFLILARLIFGVIIPFLLIDIFLLIRYPPALLRRLVMEVATSPLGAWGKLYIWLASILEFFDLAKALF